MPEQPRRACAVRPPALADHLELGRRRARLEPPRAPSGLLQRDVADGPRVGPPERGEEVHLGRPRPDPRQRDERLTDAVVVERGDRVEVERPVDDCRRQRADVAVLLAAEPVGAQLSSDERRMPSGVRPPSRPPAGRRRPSRRRATPAARGSAGRASGSRARGPELGQPVRLDDRREVGVCGAQLGGRGRERRLVEHPDSRYVSRVGYGLLAMQRARTSDLRPLRARSRSRLLLLPR